MCTQNLNKNKFLIFRGQGKEGFVHSPINIKHPVFSMDYSVVALLGQEKVAWKKAFSPLHYYWHITLSSILSIHVFQKDGGFIKTFMSGPDFTKEPGCGAQGTMGAVDFLS